MRVRSAAAALTEDAWLPSWRAVLVLPSVAAPIALGTLSPLTANAATVATVK
jgi:hypothetical protein